MDDNRLAEIIVFAGPNGSGKSTLTRLLRPAHIEYINADDIKRALNCTDLYAAQYAEEQRNQCLKSGNDFCFETVASTSRNLMLLQQAKNKGYFIRCYFVLTGNSDINVLRVKSRVVQGGHDVPENKVRSRYIKSLANVQQIVSLADVCHIYDNSLQYPVRFFKKRKEECFYQCCDFWDLQAIESLTGISYLIKKDLNIKNVFLLNNTTNDEYGG